MAGRLGGGFPGYGPVMPESLDRRCLWPPATTRTTPCVCLACGLGFAQPGPDPTARSTRLANAAVA